MCSRKKRFVSWFTNSSCRCLYLFSGMRLVPQRMPAIVKVAETIVFKHLPLKELGLGEPNSVMLNEYPTGEAHVRHHADDEPLFHTRNATRYTLIVSLSLGARRMMEVKCGGSTHRFPLYNGRVVTMEGLSQQKATHAILPDPSCSRKRYNLTWRWIVSHTNSCHKI